MTLTSLNSGADGIGNQPRLKSGKKNNSKVPWIGELLLANKLITLSQLEVALVRQQELRNEANWKPLGEILIEAGFINSMQLDNALARQQQQRANLGLEEPF